MIDPAFAQTVGAAGPPPAILQVGMIAMLMGVVWFLVLRPQQQKLKEHQTMIANLKKNDEVVTEGGLIGRVVAMTDQIVTLEIASNVRVRVTRPQINRLLSVPKADDKKDD